ncbi:MAG: alpha-mannosidase, partial [Anaerolineaceae bacterium]|nr:alpha-mannosidase [Anaerolineaceae bacterium]
QVLTHFPPVNSYSALANVRDVVNNSKRYKDHENSKESYMLFGHGDGGGGPTMGMIEQVKRMNDVDGLARVEIRDPKTFYKRLEDDLIDPVKWVGELYLEYHRGTYTTQAATKKNNRLGEFLLHDIEFLSALAAHKGESYPTESLDWMWKSLLKNQFHDIIPGSSITMVYEDADNEYAKLLAHGAELRSEAVDALFCTDGDKVLAVNTTSFDREEVVALPEGTPSAQVSACGKPLGLVSAPAYGYAVVEASENAAKQVSFSETDDRYVFENDNLKAVFTKAGAMVSLFEKNVVREAIASGGKGNQFVIFEDRPCQWDAWDVDIYHLGTREEVPGAFRTAVLETGPFRASVEFEYQISETSSIKQVVSLSAASQHVDFDNQVEWHEEHRFLKVEFPFTVRSSEAAYEIQFGHLRRPTHFNTSWDMARFEVVGHKWADLSEYGFGVALLNDCKYGYSTLDNVMRLSLLRSPKNPDPVADMGSHSFKYAVMPHGGTFQQAGVIGAGYCFNAPLLVSKTGADVEARSFFGLDSSAVVIDTIKRAEDSDAFIVRMYESYGSNVDVTLSTAFEVLEAAECNLLERQDQAVDMVDGKISMHFSPFQIRTLKLKVK